MKPRQLNTNALTLAAIAVSMALQANAAQVELSSLKPVYTKQSYKQLERMASGARTIQIDNRKFEGGGLYTCANSETSYVLDGKYKSFEAWVGVDANMKRYDKGGTVVFQVFVDGKCVFDSGVMNTSTPAKHVVVDTRGIKELELYVLDAGDGKHADYSYWAEAKLDEDDAAPRAAPPGTRTAKHQVRGHGFTLELDENGGLLSFQSGGKHYEISGQTRLTGCEETAAPEIRKRSSESISVMRALRNQEGRQCRVTDTYTLTAGGVRWDVDVFGIGPAWGTGIISGVKLPVGKSAQFWEPWSNPDMLGSGLWNFDEMKASWRDPLETRPLGDSTRWYGDDGLLGYRPSSGNYVSIPLCTMLAGGGEALSFVHSPEDNIIVMKLLTTGDGTVEFQRRHNRIGAGAHVRFTMHLVPHAPRWRSALAWMIGEYPDYFSPPNPRAHDVAGLGAYSSWQGELDAAKLKKMGFSMNWKASFDFVYMGMFLPPVENWQTFATSEEARKDPWVQTPYKGFPTSRKIMSDYCKQLRDYGFHALNYFNITEFGTKVKTAGFVNRDVPESELWKDSTNFLHTKIADGILYNPAGEFHRTWGGAVIMDCAGEDYKAFLLEQARLHVEYLPESSGICIDRLDWLLFYNTHADDGITWYNGKPARSLLTSWKAFLKELSPIMHGNGKVIFANPMVAMRLDVLRWVDGIYAEHNEMGPGLNSSALLGMRKPVVTWTWKEDCLMPDPNVYFQRQLHLGVTPTAPYPDNNHTVCPSESADKWYLAYGPLFRAIKGRTWTLDADVNVEGGKARANLFTVPGGHVMPVMLGGDTDMARVVISGGAFAKPGKYKVTAIHPGNENPVAVKYKRGAEGLVLDVPLKSGCAMVQLTPQ